jgi:hypothetical protein
MAGSYIASLCLLVWCLQREIRHPYNPHDPSGWLHAGAVVSWLCCAVMLCQRGLGGQLHTTRLAAVCYIMMWHCWVEQVKIVNALHWWRVYWMMDELR